MKFKITFTDEYLKHYRRLVKQEQRQVDRKIDLLINNPMYPSLRAKRVKGQVDILECSVNMDIRILWKYDGDLMIVALDVGHHDILRKF